jgi:EAL domain-containing protein (putative c-di-GMP-specific phosphodiesterase class I)
MTGDPRVETAVQALELGALRYLVKPIGSEQLLDAVQHGVRLRRLAQLKREALAQVGDTGRLATDRAGLEAVFARALSGMWLAYQPIVRSEDGSLFGHEALLRTSEPAISHPGAFLDTAERLGRVLELGRQVRSIAARDMEALPGGTLFVNLHPLDLTDAGLLAAEAPLAGHAKQVVLEITERASLEGVTDLRGCVAQLRQLGFRIAIDDLGSGYSGLNSFAMLEPDLVKLDMGLVRGVDQQPLRRKLIRSISELCRGLGISVLAEGVETEAERDVLTGAGCNLLQGFLFGRPAPLADHS